MTLRPAIDLLNELQRLVRIALIGGAFLCFFVGGFVLSWAVLPVVCFGVRDPRRRAARCQRLVQRAFVAFHDALRHLRLVNFNPREARGRLPDHPVLLVANHPSLIDVTAIIAAYGELVCVAKGPLFRSLLVGPLLRWSGHIDAGASDGTAGLSTIDQACKRLSEDHHVLIFPEGTRSPPGELRPFKAGAFIIALRAKVDIQPLLVTTSPPALIREIPWYRGPNATVHLRVRLLSSVSTRDLPSNTAVARRLAREIRDRYALAVFERTPADDGCDASTEVSW